MNDLIKLKGKYHFVCRDKNGNVKWEDDAENTIVTEGKNHILGDVFHQVSQITIWYIGLKNAGSAAAGDTLASHAGWTENANYTGTRKEWTEGAASSGSITNSAAVDFAINADFQTIAGAFLCSATSGTTGTLMSVADFSGGSKSVDNGDTLSITYTLSFS